MIEPLPAAGALSSIENLREVLHRFNHDYVRRAGNPRNRLKVTKSQYKSYFKFAFVRNPWGRAFSWYGNVLRDQIHQRRLGVVGEPSLTRFLRSQMGRGVLRPQTRWLKDFRGKFALDFIGRFETLEEDFAEACRRMHAPLLALPHEMGGSGEDYRDHYDDESRALVARFYAEEIERFGYSFES